MIFVDNNVLYNVQRKKKKGDILIIKRIYSKRTPRTF